MCVRTTLRCVVKQCRPSLRRVLTFFIFSSVPIQEGPKGECNSDGQDSVICELGNPLRSNERVRTLKTLSCPSVKREFFVLICSHGQCPRFSPTGETAANFPDQRHRLVHARDQVATAVVNVRSDTKFRCSRDMFYTFLHLRLNMVLLYLIVINRLHTNSTVHIEFKPLTKMNVVYT